MSLDQVGLPTNLNKNSKNRQVNPFDHYEVECSKLKTIFVGEEYKNAEAVFLECSSQQKAIIHVSGKHRLVVLTNAPYMYLFDKLTKPIIAPKLFSTMES